MADRVQLKKHALTWEPVGRACGLYVRVGKEPAPRPVWLAQAIAHYGLVGDRHASPRSPRQLLVAGLPAYRRFDLSSNALRENLLVDFSTAGLRSGDLLRIGAEIVLWMTFQCEPCGVLERRCPGTLKAIGTHRGMLARVLRGGTMRGGDPVAVARSSIPGMSDCWQERVMRVVKAIPPGHYIVHRQLAELAGVATAYCRAFPRVLSRLPSKIARRVRSSSDPDFGQPWDGAEIFEVEAILDR